MTLFDQQQDPLVIDENKDYLEELVGEDKKFKDTKALARGKYEADLTIEQRNQELKQLRDAYLNAIEENKAKAGLAELLDQLKQTTSSEKTQNANESTNTQTFDPQQMEDKFKSIFQSGISEWEMQRRQEANYRTVETKAKERLGNNFAQALSQKARELNLTTEQAEGLAKNNPELFMRAFELDREPNQENFQAPPRSQRGSDTFAPNVPKRTWTYYEQLRKDKPTLYASPKIQKQMQDDIISLGEKFKDGDYNYL